MGFPVVCECNSEKQHICTGRCCGPICKAMGMDMVKEPKGTGLVFIEPSTLTLTSGLCLGPLLLSPHAMGVPWVPWLQGC